MKTQLLQSGTTVVEFALVASVFFMVLFGLIDLSRLYFDAAALNEATRRGARLAAVCPIDDPSIAPTAIFADEGTESALIPGLNTGHLQLQYLDIDGAVVPDPAAGGYGDVRFVRVEIQNFQLQSFIPGMATMIAFPSFQTTLPAESLGRVDTADIAC